MVEMNRADLIALNCIIDMGREYVVFQDSVDISDDYYYWSGYIKGLLQSDAKKFDIDMDKIDEITAWLDMWDDNDKPAGKPN